MSKDSATMRVGHTLYCLSILMIILTQGGHTLACSDSTTTDRVVGVDQAGRFVLHRLLSGGADCTEDAFIVYDAAGQVAAVYHSNSMNSEDCAMHWSLDGNGPVDTVDGESPQHLRDRLKQAMGVTPLVKAQQRIATTRSSSACLQTYLILAKGWYPVWEVQEMPFGDCGDVMVIPMRHPHSTLLFLTYTYTSGHACTHTESSVHWVHPQWVESITFYRRAEVLLNKGESAAAQQAAAQSLQLYAANPAAHLVLARALLMQGIPFDTAKELLTVAYQSHLPCQVGQFGDFISALYSDEFQPWQSDPGFDSWIEMISAQHDDAHPGENNPQSAWGPDATELRRQQN